MSQTLIPTNLLKKSNKVLFITHLALGDFTYLQNFFQAFAHDNLHLKIHLWIDEIRRTNDSTQWTYLKKYILYDWVATCYFFDKIYMETYNPILYQKSINEAQQENYPIIISLATLRPHLYANLARKISQNSLVIGIKKHINFFQLHHHLGYRKLDAMISFFKVTSSHQNHISDIYAHWFTKISGLQLSIAERFPFIKIPTIWKQYAKSKIIEWGFSKRQGKLIFINSYAKTKKRCWPLKYVIQLIDEMQMLQAWGNSNYIVNVVPEELVHMHNINNHFFKKNTRLFSAQENFFQLPAILTQCDLIISVETAIIHFANALHIPVIALMRQKNPEWIPIDYNNSTIITTPYRRDWIKKIKVRQIMEVIKLHSLNLYGT